MEAIQRELADTIREKNMANSDKVGLARPTIMLVIVLSLGEGK